MSSQISQDLKQARPKLSVVAPVIHRMLIGFAVFNILIAIGMWALPEGYVPFLIVNNVLTLEVWATIFAIVGVLMGILILRNDWKWCRRVQLLGVLIKSFWLIALLFRLAIGGSFLIVVIWGFFLYIQVLGYIYFTPVSIQNRGAENGKGF